MPRHKWIQPRSTSPETGIYVRSYCCLRYGLLFVLGSIPKGVNIII